MVFHLSKNNNRIRLFMTYKQEKIFELNLPFTGKKILVTRFLLKKLSYEFGSSKIKSLNLNLTNFRKKLL